MFIRVVPEQTPFINQMPIKPENLARYPKDWKQIRERILLRANHCCEGSPRYPDCRVPNGAYRAPNGEWGTDLDMVIAWTMENPIKIVLTIGHLDHTPENCAEDNLRAWCQRCHLTYDAKHHAESAYMTRRARRNTDELPLTETGTASALAKKE